MSDAEDEKQGAAEGRAGAGKPKVTADALPAIDFSTFILSLSTSVLYHLGLAPDPETGKPTRPNLVLARQTIDTLEILREKTRGNLDLEESRLLESLLYELHMRFVEASK